MGVGIAFPGKTYELLYTKTQRIADTRNWPRNSTDQSWSSWFKSLVRPMWRRMVGDTPDYNAKASGRHNTCVFVTLAPKEDTKKKFCVATYHMPCAFEERPVMAFHVSLVSQWVQQEAGALPYVLAGDFNIKPGDSEYELALAGQLDTDHPLMQQMWTIPGFNDGSKRAWTMKAKPMKSAYRKLNGKEPDFTNYARVSLLCCTGQLLSCHGGDSFSFIYTLIVGQREGRFH